MKTSEMCLLNAYRCAREGEHVGAFRWVRLATYYEIVGL